MGESQRKSDRGKNFTITEDEMVCQSWLATSQDPTEFINHKQLIFWDRVAEHYNKNITIPSHRNGNSLMHRWSTIQLALNKFCGLLSQLESDRDTEITESDKIIQVKCMYYKIHNKAFGFEHCLRILRGNCKWDEYIAKKNVKKVIDTIAPSTSTPSTPNTSFSLDSEIDPNQIIFCESGKRPMENNGEKELRKKKKDFYGTIEKMYTNIEKIVELLEKRETVKDERELKKAEDRSAQLHMLTMMNEREQRKDDELIMSKDTSNMNDVQKAYYDRRRAEILSRMDVDLLSS